MTTPAEPTPAPQRPRRRWVPIDQLLDAASSDESDWLTEHNIQTSSPTHGRFAAGDKRATGARDAR